jgi:hypothetical protein
MSLVSRLLLWTVLVAGATVNAVLSQSGGHTLAALGRGSRRGRLTDVLGVLVRAEDHDAVRVRYADGDLARVLGVRFAGGAYPVEGFVVAEVCALLA